MVLLNLESLRVIKPQNVFVPDRMTNQKGQKEKTKNMVLDCIKFNERITVQQIVKKTELAASTVYRVILKLESSDLIIRIFGEGKGSYGNTFFSAIK